jgi:hypothetical protein
LWQARFRRTGSKAPTRMNALDDRLTASGADIPALHAHGMTSWPGVMGPRFREDDVEGSRTSDCCIPAAAIEPSAHHRPDRHAGHPLQPSPPSSRHDVVVIGASTSSIHMCTVALAPDMLVPEGGDISMGREILPKVLAGWGKESNLPPRIGSRCVNCSVRTCLRQIIRSKRSSKTR